MKKLSKKEKKKMRKALIAKKQESLKMSGREYRAKKRKRRGIKGTSRLRTKHDQDKKIEIQYPNNAESVAIRADYNTLHHPPLQWVVSTGRKERELKQGENEEKDSRSDLSNSTNHLESMEEDEKRYKRVNELLHEYRKTIGSNVKF